MRPAGGNDPIATPWPACGQLRTQMLAPEAAAFVCPFTGVDFDVGLGVAGVVLREPARDPLRRKLTLGDLLLGA
jgi:hypothetical protein